MLQGCHTALITPLRDDGSVDSRGLEKLIEFQISSGIQGLLAVGTTGESPTLLWEEHNEVIERTCRLATDRCLAIAGTGSNSTREALAGTEHAAHVGAGAVLLVDPYYNGPSSLEIRREYVAPVAAEFPEIQVIPYIIPGRTGAKLEPEDLAIVAAAYANVATVKEATGDLANMARTRQLCGDGFSIMSGDDDLTVEMMRRDEIRAAGVISVMSNILPGPIQRLTELITRGEQGEADKLAAALQPLFGCVGIATEENSSRGPVVCKARNPVPIKALMSILGMPAGPCRRPLGKLTPSALGILIEAARRVHASDASLLAPVAEFFGVDIDARLAAAGDVEGLAYGSYE